MATLQHMKKNDSLGTQVGHAARAPGAVDDLHSAIATGTAETPRGRLESVDSAGGAESAGGTEEAD